MVHTALEEDLEEELEVDQEVVDAKVQEVLALQAVERRKKKANSEEYVKTTDTIRKKQKLKSAYMHDFKCQLRYYSVLLLKCFSTYHKA